MIKVGQLFWIGAALLLRLTPMSAQHEVMDTMSMNRLHPLSFHNRRDTVSIPSNIARKKPEIFTNGFLDVLNNGQVNASARFIRLYIGEPGKLAIPIAVYGGVSANNFSDFSSYGLAQTNETLAANLINPLSGLMNACLDDLKFLGRDIGITRFGILYQIGERVLTGYKPSSFGFYGSQAVNFLNAYGVAGLYFQTGAWEKNDVHNGGLFWFSARWIGCYTNPLQLKNILPGLATTGMYHGYSLGWGVEINNLINLKLIFYKYIRQLEKEFVLPIYQFSFNYSLKT